MKKIYLLVITGILLTLKGNAQVIEVVDTKDINDQTVNGKSYQFLTQVRLQPTFYWSASTRGAFFIKPFSIQNQPATLNKNWVRTETLLDKFTDENSISTLTSDKKSTVYNYFDGLGRASQDITVQASPLKFDVVKRHEYDGFGRQLNDYLPYSVSTPMKGAFRSSAGSETTSFYSSTPNVKSDTEPYTINKYDDSPFNQVLQEYGVGQDWHPSPGSDKPVQTKILTNVAGEVMQWTYNGPNPPSLTTPNPPSLNISGYPANQLIVTQTIDEQGQIRKSYKNFKGQQILSRVGDGNTWLDTYYIYDWEGNVFCVVPPEASAQLSTAANYASASASTQQTFLNSWCFQYDYDSYQRVRAKKIPGATSWVYMVYDKYDRLVMTWDGTLTPSIQEQWIFTKYDQFNRSIATGFYYAANGTDAATVQGIVDSYYTTNPGYRYESRTNSATGYTLNTTFPALSDDSNLLTVTYYDDYAFTAYTGWDAEGHSYSYIQENNLPSGNFSAVKAQTTGSKTRLLGSTTWLNSVSYYDTKYRLIQTISENHLSGLDRVSDNLDFVGRKVATLRTHSSSLTGVASDSFTALEEYFYDQAGRLTQTYQTLDPGTGTRTLISSNSYNEKGELIEKNLHSTDNGNSFLQSVDYRYNIRGWLTSINNSSLSNDGSLNNDSNDIFGMELLYNSPFTINSVNTTPLWNGNINAIKWQSTNLVDAHKEKVFGFTYDFLNRIRTSSYATNNSGIFNGDADAYKSTYSYTENGNINGLTRNGFLGGSIHTIDNLSYGYTANRLSYVNDGPFNNDGPYNQFGSKGQGFVEKSNMQASEYAYDAAGNATQDVNRGIDVSYNHLNRPTKVSFGPNDYILYTYDASGAKLKEQVYQGGSLIVERNYVGGVHYEKGPTDPTSISFVKIKEGRALKANGAWSYEYSLTDHQGNAMATFGNLRDASVYQAFMEDNDSNVAANEQSTFLNVSPSRRSTDFNNTKPTAVTPLPNKSIRTNGATSGYENGPAKKLPVVNSGDHINVSVYARYLTPSPNAQQSGAILGSLAALAISNFGISSTELAYNGFNNYYPSGAASITANGTAPKAYLNYILFNSTFTSNQFGFVSVPTSAASGFQKLVIDINVPSGYNGGVLYIFTTNESNYNTYFDDIKILHEKGASVLQVTQQSDYYPFGVAFNSWNKGSVKANRYTYQGQENQDDLDYNEYMYKFRMHDPSMGRFLSVDPLSEKYMYNSPYAFSENRVIDGHDLEGKEFAESISSFFVTTKAVTEATVSNPGFGDYVKTAVSGLFRSTGIGQGLTNIQYGGQTGVSNRIDYALNGGQRMQNTYSSGGDPGRVYDQFKNTDDLATKQIAVGTAQVALSTSELQMGLFAGGLSASRLFGQSTTFGYGLKPNIGSGQSFAFGSDASTMKNMSNMVTKGWDNLLVHGQYDGFRVDGNFISPEKMAEMLYSNGYVKGTPIRCISCWTGVQDEGAAFQLSKYLDAPVIAPTNRISVLDGGDYFIDGGGYWNYFNFK